PPVTEPTLTAASATDLSLDFSALGTGNKADGSAGEATFSVMFMDKTGAAAAGQAITWNITNNGAQNVFYLGSTVLQINAGASRSVSAKTDADGSATAIFDSEGDKTAGSTSLSVTASTSAPNSDNVSRALSVAFSATWDVPVPAELAIFAGQVTTDKNVLLQWSVVSQSNNLGWEVYRSTDKARFEKVGEMVLGAGTSDELVSYSFTDSGYPAVDAVYYYLKQIDLSGHTARSSVIEVLLSPAQVLPTANELKQNFPNPFNPETTITFDLKANTVVELSIYDMTGQHIRTLVNGQALSAGNYSYHWNGFDDSGAKVGSGIYLYHLQSGEFTSVKKMTLLK
ncbi:MAG: T9SS type A sorting domain-containing protein, partial [Candidatus Latescibacteria bacterium]|nr:T9SS type A sorting domain-containing protein [Candidatus Latescibacterota bacterium]